MSAAQGTVDKGYWQHILCKTDHRGNHVVIRSQEQIWTRTQAIGCGEKVLVVHFQPTRMSFCLTSQEKGEVLLFVWIS